MRRQAFLSKFSDGDLPRSTNWCCAKHESGDESAVESGTITLKKLLITLLKVGISAAIIGYLVYDATQSKEHGNVFVNLRNQPKQWGPLAAAWACCTAAALLTFVRWWYLVRALDIPCLFRDAVRISFWGYLLNLAPLGGIVSGDLTKALMLDHEHPQHRAKALASVVVDRVIGLYILFIVASTAILLTQFWKIPDMWWICTLTFIVTIAGTVGLGVVMGPDMTEGRVILRGGPNSPHWPVLGKLH